MLDTCTYCFFLCTAEGTMWCLKTQMTQVFKHFVFEQLTFQFSLLHPILNFISADVQITYTAHWNARSLLYCFETLHSSVLSRFVFCKSAPHCMPMQTQKIIRLNIISRLDLVAQFEQCFFKKKLPCSNMKQSHSKYVT